jgi:hypothetical protein
MFDPRSAIRTPHSLAWALRVLVLALLGWQLWALLQPVEPAARSARAGADALDQWLVEWSGQRFPDSVHLTLRRAPSRLERAWVAALRRSGAGVVWTDAGIPATALEVYPLGGPAGGSRILLAGEAGSLAELASVARWTCYAAGAAAARCVCRICTEP